MKILVTGAGGFLGRNVVKLLEEQGEEVVALYRPGAKNVINSKVTPVFADLTDRNFTRALPRDIDAILHLAQSALYKSFPQTSFDIFDVNVSASVDLFEFARSINAKTFLMASSGSVYSPSGNPIPESTPPKPTDFYGATKLAAEYLANPYREYLNICCLRIFTLYGPDQKNSIIPILIDRLKNKQPITLFGKDGIELQPTHVTDAASICASALTQSWNSTYNLASPYKICIRELSERIGYIIGEKPLFKTESPKESILPELTKLAAKYPITNMLDIRGTLPEIIRYKLQN